MIKRQVELLDLTEREVMVMRQMSRLVGNNARIVKRFVNIFRIIKAHEDFSYKNEETMRDLIAVLFMLSLSLGPFRKLVPYFVEHISVSTAEEGLIGTFLIGIHSNPELDGLARQLDMIVGGDMYLTLDAVYRSSFIKHYHFIKRFTFKDI